MAVIIYEDCNETVAHLPGVRAHIASRSRKAAARAKAKLLGHRVRGDAHIEHSMGTLDGYVSLVDPPSDANSGKPNAMAIEFGRTGARGRGASQGIHVLQGIW